MKSYASQRVRTLAPARQQPPNKTKNKKSMKGACKPIKNQMNNIHLLTQRIITLNNNNIQTLIIFAKLKTYKSTHLVAEVSS